MKNIILCADGTWNTPHADSATRTDTNVRKFYCALLNETNQLKYYDSGVGTDGTPIDHLSGGAMGEGLFQKVQDCYEFLSHVYDPGDKIFLFGFSRGAFTARSTAGMIAGFGVPTINLDNLTVKRIFDAYREPDPAKKEALKIELARAYAMHTSTYRWSAFGTRSGRWEYPEYSSTCSIRSDLGFSTPRYIRALPTGITPCVSMNTVHNSCRRSGRTRMALTGQTMTKSSKSGFRVSIATWEAVTRIVSFRTSP